MNDTALRITPGRDRRSARRPHPVAIDIRDLDFYYGKSHALKHVDHGVPANCVTAIIGPSGCGKSTLLRTINRIFEIYPDQHAAGEIVIDGATSSTAAIRLSELRRQVGMVFQKPTPFPSSIRSNVAFALSYYERLSKSRGERPDRRCASPGGAVGRGQGQAQPERALACPAASSSGCASRARSPCGPEILLLDEPTSALDPISTAKVEELIDELRERFTIVIVTHNMQQAARVSQRTAFFHLGELIEFGNT